MKKLNEAVIEALVRLFDQENKFVLANPVSFRKEFVEATRRWASEVEPHRNPDGSIRVFLDEEPAAVAEQPAPEIVFGPDENGVFIYKIPGRYPYWTGQTVNGQFCAYAGHKTLQDAMDVYDRVYRKSYTVNGHRLEIVADPVTIDGERVDVVRTQNGKYDIIRRQGREYYNASMPGWFANSDAASDACYLTAAAAIADRAHLAGGAA